MVTVSLKRIVFEIFDFENKVVTLKFGSKVTQGHRNRRDRSATYDFLLTLHSMSLSRIVFEINGDFNRKSQFFQPPCI